MSLPDTNVKDGDHIPTSAVDGKDRRTLRRLVIRIVKWTIGIVCSCAIFLFLGLFALIGYLSRDTCDEAIPSPVVRNLSGDTAEGQFEACTWIGTVINESVTLQIHRYPRLWPRKVLIDFESVGYSREPILRWIDEKTLSVDLGDVSWVSSRIEKAGDIKIVYSYRVVDKP